MNTAEKFLRYVKVHSASVDRDDITPTSAVQFDLARLLEKEMRDMGMENVVCDEHAYVYGYISATKGYEHRPCIGFIAHLDTIPDFSGENVNPQIVENYAGGDVKLGESGRMLSVDKYPHLKELVGQTLITTDGTTVLGADDKAGVAAIMAACEKIIREEIHHGPIAVCFTPDEEVGHGAALLDIEAFGADFAYTVDGGELNEVNCETFNAAAANWEIKGLSVHPGDAKNTMINASLVAMEINSMLPAGDTPAHTEGYEGFYHLTDMQGDVEQAKLSYIVRDHDGAKLEMRKETLRHIEELINEKYGAGTAKLSLRDQYRNMFEKVNERPEIMELAEKALRALGMEPERKPIRGGTDGAQLSFRGLLCPNLGTGGYAGHGPYEHTTVENLDTAAKLVLEIVELNCMG